MSLFELAMQEMRTEVIRELEDRIWERLMPRIEQELHARHMSIAELAVYLHVSEQTVRRLIRTREIPSFKVRNQIFVRQMDVDAWVDRQVVR